MKKQYIIISVLMAFSLSYAQAQDLISAEFLGSKTKSEIFQETFLQVAFSADIYKVLYTSDDAMGNLDTLSGIISLPVSNEELSVPILFNQHGTTDGKYNVPSTDGTDDFIAMVGGGSGYITLQPDYVGMGEGRGFHPYVHAATQAQAAIDMLIAYENSVGILPGNINQNDQIFITGYSQGGHASMALHRELETNYSNEYTVTAAAHLSGPYSISKAMINRVLDNTPYNYVAYLAYIILGYQEVYGDLYNDLTDIFKQPYADAIETFYDNYDNGASVFGLNNQLINLLVANVGSPTASEMFQPDVIQRIIDKPANDPLIDALRDNDTYDWAPDAKTWIIYCQADDQVTFRNAIIADSVMQENGATDLTLLNIQPNASHTQCVAPAYFFTITEFNKLANIVIVNTTDISKNPLRISPNPATDMVTVQMPGNVKAQDITIFNSVGQVVESIQLDAAADRISIETNQLPAGMYTMRLSSENIIHVGRLIIH